jgi:ketosteroid isomerase-like protein
MTVQSAIVAGADTEAQATLAAVERFSEAFDRHDVDAIMAAMTDDCLFDNTPPPDGELLRGAAAVRAFWQRFFTESPSALFETEELFVAGDRCVTRWRYSWRDAAGIEGHIRGSDLFRVRAGKVAEKRSYVKG